MKEALVIEDSDQNFTRNIEEIFEEAKKTEMSINDSVLTAFNKARESGLKINQADSVM